MRPSVRDVAAGKWHGLLLGFGLSERQLSGKHCPCPICGGNDRFRFDDKCVFRGIVTDDFAEA